MLRVMCLRSDGDDGQMDKLSCWAGNCYGSVEVETGTVAACDEC